ncbi:hypothetical protein AB0D34_06485 [Streptomyces sp. NPDC048420]|uniref:hypothetical protein n=1 Tax=Streptomyces sp. NPDC048420 TaxID=3155755 RepID=UPI00343A44EE
MPDLGTRLLLWLGATVPRPAPPYVLHALTSAEVTADREKGDGFQLTFSLVKDRTLDFPLLREPLFTPGTRVVIGVLTGIVPHILMDGTLIHQQVSGDTLTLTGQDIVGGVMSLEEKDDTFENQSDSTIATRIITRYARFGLIPDVTNTPHVPLSVQHTPQQHETDRAFLERIARRNGFVFYVQPLTLGVNTAHWGPEIRLGLPQPALSKDMGSMSNVKSLSFSFDALEPVQPQGVFTDPLFKLSLPVPALPSLKIPPLAASPAPALRSTKLRTTAGKDTVAAATELLATATAAPNAVSGEGELDTSAYGHVLRPRRLVGIRGCGLSLDGLYLVDSVTHKLARGEYTQRFRISREGLGTTTPGVPI